MGVVISKGETPSSKDVAGVPITWLAGAVDKSRLVYLELAWVVPRRPRERLDAVQALAERNEPHRSDKIAILHHMWKN